MSEKPTLLVLAAGMGSRYGGLKQLDGMGPGGETILEYSVFDAKRAGFGRVVFVIREDFASAFEQDVAARFRDHLEVDLAFQRLDDLPAGCDVPADRKKPWGTAHAVYAARNVIDGPFAAINADDFYGLEAFRQLAGFLSQETAAEPRAFAMVGYRLGNTLSEHGTVSRGICRVDAGGMLERIDEFRKLKRLREQPGMAIDEETGKLFPLHAPASMNCFGLGKSVFRAIEERIQSFFQSGDPARAETAEVYLPAVVTSAIEEDRATVKVLESDARWLGVTHREDREPVRSELEALTAAGIYPRSLWT